ncbi:Zinc/iron permease [Kalaharituber pfeilii]|nr:Zinc/iron permease [Kalaharituber pfeilii]
MAEGLFTLILFSIAMAVASFGAGMLPLAMTLSPSRMRLISAIGMGVLVGTSLIVIIPEGIDTLYSVKAVDTHKRSWTSNSDLSILTRRLPSAEGALDTSLAIEIPPLTPRNPEADNNGDVHDGDHHDHSSEIPSPHAYIGLSLIAGFILMYLIDTLPPLISHLRSSSSSAPSYITLNNLSSAPIPSSPTSPPQASFSITTGLVIHAAADGIALGASATSSNLALEAIIFVAIMLHKAPAAFGLSAVLLKNGLGKRQARAHLMVFSFAAPVGALGTWAVINLLGGGGIGVNRVGMQWWTGVLLLFSGGTFLYVAMHTMQDNSSSSHDHERDGYSSEEASYLSGPRKEKAGPSIRDTAAAMFGMLIPLVTQVGHSHAH